MPKPLPIANLSDVNGNRPLSPETTAAIRAQHHDTAQTIMFSEAKQFALAARAGDLQDVALTGEALRQAIYRGLCAAFAGGIEWQKRNGGADRIEESLT